MALRWQYYNQSALQEKIIGTTIDIIASVETISDANSGRLPIRLHLNLKKIRALDSNGSWTPASGSIIVHTSRAENILVSDTIQLNAVHCKKNTNHSFEQYLTKMGYIASFFLPRLQATVLHRPNISVSRTLAQLRATTLNSLEKRMSAPLACLFSSIFLGKKTGNQIDQRYRTQFNRWGISHYLARSGLHLVIIALLWHCILGLLGLSYRMRHCSALVLIGIYSILSWAGIPFMRALTVFILHTIGTLLELEVHTLHLLNLVCIGMLIINPIQLFFLDFQLSFGITYALLLGTRSNS